jgi:site-specific recombinase XerC
LRPLIKVTEVVRLWRETPFRTRDVSRAKRGISTYQELSAEIQTRSDKIKFLRDRVLWLRRFYAWLVYCKKIKENPCANLNPARPQQKINVCSDEQIKGLMSYTPSTQVCDIATA